MKFGDIIEGATMNEQVDEVTGLSRKVIVEFKDRDSEIRPRVSIKDERGRTIKIGYLQNVSLCRTKKFRDNGLATVSKCSYLLGRNRMNIRWKPIKNQFFKLNFSAGVVYVNAH